MMKWLLIIAVVLVVVWLLKKPRAVRRGTPRRDAKPQDMQSCAHCGVYLPAADAVRDVGGRPFCSEAHRLAGPRGG